MKRKVLLDTGPLVALIDKADRDHLWSVEQWAGIEPPMLTCESVISEACFLLDQVGRGADSVLEMLIRRTIVTAFELDENAAPIRALLKKYSDTPMSVADACLVRMSEQIPGSSILTLDSDFRGYRKHGRQVLELIAPKRI